MNQTFKIAIVPVICAMLMFSGGCSGHSRAGGAEHESTHAHGHSDGETSHLELTATQMNTVGIELGTIRHIEISSGLRVSGTIELNPSDVADVTPLLSGVIRSIKVAEGEAIHRGRILAYIENAEIIGLQEQFLAAAAREKLAQEEYNRQKALNREGAGIVKNLQRAETELSVARVELQSLGARLRQAGIAPESVAPGNFTSQIPVTSPIDGIVNKIWCTVGSYTDYSTPMFQIVNPHGAYCRLQIYERDVDKVKVGEKVEIKLINAPGETFTGEVISVGRAIDSTTKAITARVAFNHQEPKTFAPGMAVNAIISTGSELCEALPDGAFVSAGGKTYVFILEDIVDENGEKTFHFEKTEVVTGESELGMTAFTLLDKAVADADTKFAVTNAFYLGSMSSDHGEHNH